MLGSHWLEVKNGQDSPTSDKKPQHLGEANGTSCASVMRQLSAVLLDATIVGAYRGRRQRSSIFEGSDLTELSLMKCRLAIAVSRDCAVLS